MALAVTLLSGIIQNHPFVDGNKRTALIAARALLRRNGYDIDFPDDIDLGEFIKAFAEGHLAEEFADHLVPL